jgi:hypothetical protein
LLLLQGAAASMSGRVLGAGFQSDNRFQALAAMDGSLNVRPDDSPSRPVLLLGPVCAVLIDENNITRS